MNTDSLWFMDTRIEVRLSNRDNDKRLSILEQHIPHGFSPPTHVHHDETETFCILEGTFRFELEGKVSIGAPGDVVHIPAGATHSFVALSPDGGRFLTITDGGFEDMVREASRPAANDGLPASAGAPTPAQQQMLAQACLRNGIELLGAPLAA